MLPMLPSFERLCIPPTEEVGVQLQRNQTVHMTGITFDSYLFIQSNGDRDPHVVAVRYLTDALSFETPGAFSHIPASPFPGTHCKTVQRTVIQGSTDGAQEGETSQEGEEHEEDGTDEDAQDDSDVAPARRKRRKPGCAPQKVFHYKATLHKAFPRHEHPGRPHTYFTNVSVTVYNGSTLELLDQKVKPVKVLEYFPSRDANSDPD